MKINILIADDEIHILKKIQKIITFEHNNFEVIATVKNGIQALQFLEQHSIDLLISDIRMPEMNGIDLATIVHDQYPMIKIILITGYEEFEYAKKAIRLNVTAFLLKPIKSAELNSILNELLLSFSKEKELDFGLTISNQTSTKECVSLIKKHIQENYLEHISLGKLSKKFGFSQSYLTCIFLKFEGTTPLKYQIDMRMNIAKKHLKDPSLSIADVANLLNYSDQFSFSKAFKNHENMSPMNYKKANIDN